MKRTLGPRARWLVTAGVLLVLGSMALEVVHENPHAADPNWTTYWWNHVPGFYAALGFVGCWVIVKFSKLLGKIWLQRPEDYYERD